MADKQYKITFDLSDGTQKSVEFTSPQGEKGDKGDTPVKGVDYWTDADKQEIVNQLSGQVEVTSDYVIAEAERVVEAITASRTAKSLVLLCASDIHTLMTSTQSAANIAQSKATTLHLAQGMNEICKRTAVDGIAILGDSVTGGPSSTIQECKDELDYLRVNLGNTQGVPQIWLEGNHDHNSQNSSAGYLTDDELYARIGANTTDKAVTDYDNLHRMYGYVDYDRQRIRVIYLNTADITDSYTADYGMTTVQAQWFVDTLAAVSAGWGVVVMSHHPLNGYISTALGVLTILDAFKGKQSGSVTVGGGAVAYDFANMQGELICHLHGHIHNYQAAIYGTNGVLSITIPNGCFGRNNEYGRYYDAEMASAWGDADADGNQRVFAKTADTAEDTAYTAVVIDRKNGKVHALRCGAGVDRVWDYVNGVEIEVETSEDPDASIVNLVPTAIADDTGAIFNAPYGYMNGKYLSSSAVNTFSDDSACVATGSILLPEGVESIYVKGATWDTTNSHARFFAGSAVGGLSYTTEADGGGSQPIGNLVTLETLGDNYYKFTLTANGKTYLYGKYYRFSLVGTGENLIITHDQPITDDSGSSGDTSDGSGDSTASYTNLVPTATDATGEVFNGTGYMMGKRWSSSSTTFDTYKDDTETMLIGMIPFTIGQTLRIKGADIENLTYSMFKAFKADRSNAYTGYLSFYNALNSAYPTEFTIDGDSVVFAPSTASTSIPSDMAYIGIVVDPIDGAENVIVTVDEPIE